MDLQACWYFYIYLSIYYLIYPSIYLSIYPFIGLFLYVFVLTCLYDYCPYPLSNSFLFKFIEFINTTYDQIYFIFTVCNGKQ